MGSSLAGRIPGVAPVRRWISGHDQQLLRVAIIVLVLVGAFALGRRPSLLALLGLAGIVVVLMFYRWPVMGALLTIVGGMSISYSGPSGLNVTMFGMAL